MIDANSNRQGCKVIHMGITPARLSALLRWWPHGAPVRDLVGLRARHGVTFPLISGGRS